MADKFRGTGRDQERNGQRGSSQRMLLLVLLLLVAVFGYVYFFTGLIRPRQEAPPPAVAQKAPEKKPIPPRPAGGGESAKPEEQKGAAPAAKPAPAPQPQTAAAPKPAPAPQPQTAAAPKPAPAPPPKSAPQAAKPAPAPPAKATPKAPQPAPAVAAKAPEKKEAKPSPAPKGAPPAKEAKAAGGGGGYALLVTDLVTAPAVKAATAKLKKNGITPVRKSVVRKSEPMIRLFVADFPDREAAATELESVKKAAGSAFMLPENGRYAVYAGSYFLESKAAVERDRLSARGVRTEMKKSHAPVPVVRLTAGSFASQEEARKGAARLKGLKVAVIKTGK